MIRLYPLTTMKHTPFVRDWSLDILREHGIAITNEFTKADVFVTRKYSSSLLRDVREFGLRTMLRIAKPILLWTHEPRFCTLTEPKVSSRLGFDVHVMNVYTRDVHLCNHTIYGHCIDQRLRHVKEAEFLRSEEPMTVALATFIWRPRKAKLLINERNIDLTIPRQELILTGHREGLVDVYGQGWPDHVVSGESRGPGWPAEKQEILRRYRFNICLENTDFDYYCSEKIWDSIKGRCLPIYKGGGNRIYDDFPQESFVDIDEFDNTAEVFDYLRGVSAVEWCAKMNRCIDAFNAIFDRSDWEQRRREGVLMIVEKVREIA